MFWYGAKEGNWNRYSRYIQSVVTLPLHYTTFSLELNLSIFKVFCFVRFVSNWIISWRRISVYVRPKTMGYKKRFNVQTNTHIRHTLWSNDHRVIKTIPSSQPRSLCQMPMITILIAWFGVSFIFIFILNLSGLSVLLFSFHIFFFLLRWNNYLNLISLFQLQQLFLWFLMVFPPTFISFQTCLTIILICKKCSSIGMKWLFLFCSLNDNSFMAFVSN